MQQLFTKIFFLIGVLFLCLRMNGQKDSSFFKNQGEQENYWAKEKFRNEYKKEIYKRYGGQIKELDSTVYKYDSQIFKVIESSSVIRQLFTLGILYPSLIATNLNMADSLTDGKKAFRNPFQADTLSISNIEELKFFEISPKVKRFRFWLSWNGIANPFVYLFELTNESATKETDMENFIKGALLTFFKQGWIVI